MDKKAFLVKLGNNVVKLRSNRNWSQSDLARAAEKDRQSIERLENGKINPTIYYLNQIAQALGVTLPELLNF